MIKEKSIYVEKGYKSRSHYLQSIAEDYGVEPAAVLAIAGLLGPGEDFDGLLTAVEDLSDENPDGEIIEYPVVPFKMGDHLMHPHSGKEVIVERDNGGCTVYVAFLGTGRTQSIPRDALVTMPEPDIKKNTTPSVSKVSQKTEKKPSIDSPFKLDTAAFMAEVNVCNYVLLMKKLFNEDVVFDHAENNWGMTKMRMSNRVRGLLTKKLITDDRLWEILRESIDD